MLPNLKSYFLLDPDIVFLNHGSFGACPRPVFEVYQAWQHELERQPVLFLGRKLQSLDWEARSHLAEYLGAAADDLAFIPNATYGVNLVGRGLPLEPGDEILTSNHEYGACDYAWEFICRQTRAQYIRQPVSLPVVDNEQMVEALWAGVTPRTRLIFLSHITSPTALRFPVEEICQRARAAGILTLIDGAHAPGLIPLNLPEAGADFYTGNCHKWMLSPKGAGFLYACPEVQHLVQPLIVSWGYHADSFTTTGSQFLDYLQWTGTHDPAAALSVPAAIKFMHNHAWEAVRRDCRTLLDQALRRIQDLTGLASLYPERGEFYSQMAAAPLPQGTDLAALKSRLYEEYRVEVPMIEWNGQKLVRISIQGYNNQADINILLEGLAGLLTQVQSEARPNSERIGKV